MKFIVENEPFAKALALVKSCVPSRSTIPILLHVAVEAKADNTIVIRATNLDREAEATLPADVKSAGSAALPGEVLAALARKLTKGGQASFDVAKDRCKIVSGSSRYDLRTLDLEKGGYPARKHPGEGAVEFSVKGSELAGLIQSTVYAAADRTDERRYFQGVCLHVEANKLIAVASDSKRFALRTIPMPKGSATMPSIIVPADTAKQMAEFAGASDEDVQLIVSPKMIELRCDGVRLAGQLVDGKFPEYQNYIPKPNGGGVTFRPYALSEAIARASVVYLGEVNTDARVPFAGFSIADGNIEIQCGATASERAVETVEAETNGTKLSFRTNANFMMEMLAVWPESVSVEVQQHKEGAPILFISKEMPEATMIVMPTMKG